VELAVSVILESARKGTPYQTQIKALMQAWVVGAGTKP
jgi:hypothetical protein